MLPSQNTQCNPNCPRSCNVATRSAVKERKPTGALRHKILGVPSTDNETLPHRIQLTKQRSYSLRVDLKPQPARLPRPGIGGTGTGTYILTMPVCQQSSLPALLSY